MIKKFLPVALAGVLLLYLFFFFSASFQPYEELNNRPYPKGLFFSSILLPDEYFSAWFGPYGIVSLWDRIPIAMTALLCFLAAMSLGGIILADRFKHLTERLGMLEFLVLSTVFGLGVFSTLSTLVFLFHRVGDPVLGGWMITGFIAFCIGPFLLSRIVFFFRNFSLVRKKIRERISRPFREKTVFLVVLPFFMLLTFFGGMIPSTDYDVLSYHFPAAAEMVASKGIAFNPTNVYANMPLGAEMFVVWGIALLRDPFSGAMVGKTLIAMTTPLTGLGLYFFGKRFFSERVGIFAALFYVGTPWIFYVSTAGLIDSVVGMYAFFAIYAAALSRKSSRHSMVILSGFFAGSAAACKYPAVLFVVFPLGVYFLVVQKIKDGENADGGNFRTILFRLSVYAFGVVLACGGWYCKNWQATGNPVYPLCYSVFGDSTGTWNADVDARWNRIHRPHDFAPKSFLNDFYRVGLSSPWNAPLTIPCIVLLPVAWSKLDKEQRWLTLLLSGWTVFLFACWWFLTHRIDRFWLPAVPVMCLLAAVGACWTDRKVWKYSFNILSIPCFVFMFLLCGSAAPGKLNYFFAPLGEMRRDPNLNTPWSVWFNEHKPDGKILLVGEAKAFLYDVPVLYNVCFNETPLKGIVESSDPKREFDRLGISHILVDWAEIQRFRSPGNYGFSDYVTPAVLNRLVAANILERIVPTKELDASSSVAYRVRK